MTNRSRPPLRQGADWSSRADPTPTATATARAAAGSNDPIQPVLVKTISYRIAPVQPAPLAPMPALVRGSAPQPEAPRTVVAAADTVPPVTDRCGQVRRRSSRRPPSRTVAKTAVSRSRRRNGCAGQRRTRQSRAGQVRNRPAQARARGGWLIQIGAFDGEDEAKQHLSAAQIKVHDSSPPPIRSPSACRRATRRSTAPASPASTRRPPKPPASSSSATTSSAWRSRTEDPE